MRLGIIGGGVVGRAYARAYTEHVEEVRVYDHLTERCTHTVHDVVDCDLIFVCLPTPQKEGSRECDLTAVDNFFAARWNTTERNYVLRSTVPIGTTEALRAKYNLTNLVYSPEFLTARCAIADAALPARNIVGVPNFHETDDPHNNCSNLLCHLYDMRYPGVLLQCMTPSEAEAVKLLTNAFFAVKVSLFNEFRCLTDVLGLNWEVVRAGILSDGRITATHTQVPGHDGKRGFGGACLPKDLANLIECMDALNRQTEVKQTRKYAHPIICRAAETRNIDVDRYEEK